MDKIISDHKVSVVINTSHLELMIRALRDFIMEQNKENLDSALGQLKKGLDFDSTAIDHLHLALYSFQVRKKKRHLLEIFLTYFFFRTLLYVFCDFTALNRIGCLP